jgi:hypothetical protein
VSSRRVAWMPLQSPAPNCNGRPGKTRYFAFRRNECDSRDSSCQTSFRYHAAQRAVQCTVSMSRTHSDLYTPVSCTVGRSFTFELLIKEEAQWRIRDAPQQYPNYDQAGISADPLFGMYRGGLEVGIGGRLCAEYHSSMAKSLRI